MLVRLYLTRFLGKHATPPAQDSTSALFVLYTGIFYGTISLQAGLATLRDLTQSYQDQYDVILRILSHYQLQAAYFTEENVRDFISTVANFSVYFPQLLTAVLPTVMQVLPPKLAIEYFLNSRPDTFGISMRLMRLLKNISNYFKDVAQATPGDILYYFVAQYCEILTPLSRTSHYHFMSLFAQKWEMVISLINHTRNLIISNIEWLSQQQEVFARIVFNCLAFKGVFQYFKEIIPLVTEQESFLKAFFAKFSPLTTCSDQLMFCVELAPRVYLQPFIDINVFLEAIIDVRTRKYVHLFDEIIYNQLVHFGDDVLFELKDNEISSIPHIMENGAYLKCYRYFTEE